MPPALLLEGGPGVPTFLEEPPGPEEGVPERQAGPRVLLENTLDTVGSTLGS